MLVTEAIQSITSRTAILPYYSRYEVMSMWYICVYKVYSGLVLLPMGYSRQCDLGLCQSQICHSLPEICRQIRTPYITTFFVMYSNCIV
jgi:hypothetical protein